MDEFEIFLDGDFGFEITYANFTRALAEAGGKNLNIKINSPGGSVSEATAMRNSLESYMRKNPNAKVHFTVEGWAQSAATYLMTTPGTTSSVGADSLYMYHNPSSLAWGDHNVMQQQAQFLRDLANTYAQAYAARSGKSIEDTHAEMDAETYFIGQAIVDAGFADSVEGEQSDTMRAESVVVAMGRERFKQTIGRLAAAAYGARQTNEPRPETPVVDDNNTPGDTEMSNETKPETKPDVSMETKRAQAWMAATQAEPKMAAALQQKFLDGSTIDFFNGIVAAAEMRAAADSQTTAAAETKAIGTVNTGELDATAKAAPKTPGATGETVEAY